MVDLRNCKKGDKLLSKNGLILKYIGPLSENNYYDHEIEYPSDYIEKRCLIGRVYKDTNKVHLDDIIDIIKIIRSPYLEKEVVTIIKEYNPEYGDDRLCLCGHSYYRHFDSYEDMYPSGCKYCGCYEFVEK